MDMTLVVHREIGLLFKALSTFSHLCLLVFRLPGLYVELKILVMQYFLDILNVYRTAYLPIKDIALFARIILSSFMKNVIVTIIDVFKCSFS